MSPLESLGFALGAAFASGLNLYATVATLGLLHRFDVLDLPANLEVLANPLVLGTALFLYAVEFIADKIPYVDTVWDVIHTFIRPPAAALLAWAALAPAGFGPGGAGEAWRLAAALLAGGLALTSHGAKASTRAGANASPEPASNWLLSLLEDGLAIGIAWMAVSYPLWTLAIVALLTAASIYLIVKLFGVLRRWLARSRGRRSTLPSADGS
ncbi:MAG: DUF4126 domain-containing protein [Verrucomicrobiales bacterium]|nr:DUF4126 domain-containing protein [Verrucomicrobiales bacterium]